MILEKIPIKSCLQWQLEDGYAILTEKEKESKAVRIINFGSLNIDKVYRAEQFVRPGQTITVKDCAVVAGGFGGIRDRCLARRHA